MINTATDLGGDVHRVASWYKKEPLSAFACRRRSSSSMRAGPRTCCGIWSRWKLAQPADFSAPRPHAHRGGAYSIRLKSAGLRALTGLHVEVVELASLRRRAGAVATLAFDQRESPCCGPQNFGQIRTSAPPTVVQ